MAGLRSAGRLNTQKAPLCLEPAFMSQKSWFISGQGKSEPVCRVEIKILRLRMKIEYSKWPGLNITRHRWSNVEVLEKKWGFMTRCRAGERLGIYGSLQGTAQTVLESAFVPSGFCFGDFKPANAYRSENMWVWLQSENFWFGGRTIYIYLDTFIKQHTSMYAYISILSDLCLWLSWRQNFTLFTRASCHRCAADS